MPSTLLFTFDNNDQRQKFIDMMNQLVFTLSNPNGKNLENKADGWEEREADGQFIEKVLTEIIKDPVIKEDKDRVVALFVSGQKIMEGLLPELNKRFSLEVGSHTASVEIREQRGEEWVTIRKRMRKQQ